VGEPSVLLLNNHPLHSGNPGQVEALQFMAGNNEIGEVSILNAGPRADETQQQRDLRVIQGIRDSRSDVILALSLKGLIRDMERVQQAVAGRTLIYWEGDAWGPRKPVGPEMAAWLAMADHVFSVGGSPQVELLQASGAGTVHHTIHTYDHVLFADSERGDWAAPDAEIVFIGSHLSKVLLVSGLPGSAGRWRLVRSLKRRYREDFLVAGAGWPKGVSIGRVDFGEQDRFIQRARLLVNWDHYADVEAYTSDRLAIAMIAGRAQVTTSHPGMQWLPGPESGLYLESSVGGVIRRTAELLNGPAESLAGRGRAAHAWARKRISHREALRHMLSTVFPEIERPPADPWDALPGPWPPS